MRRVGQVYVLETVHVEIPRTGSHERDDAAARALLHERLTGVTIREQTLYQPLDAQHVLMEYNIVRYLAPEDS